MPSMTATSVEGPTECDRGDIIYVNISAAIHFNPDRYDVGIYTATTGCNPSAPASCGLEAETCAVDILGHKDYLNAPANILQNDPRTQNNQLDSCYDIVAPGGGFDLMLYEFQKNLEIPCDDIRADNETGTKTVHMQSCFSWRTQGNDENCDTCGAFPGTSSKCFCQYINLNITIKDPTTSPTTSPTGTPSKSPSDSPTTTKPTTTQTKNPSKSPSKSPSSSPSEEPSESPSNTPSSMPSETPSSQPSSMPSESPSSQPSSQPSESPSSQPSSM
ncbi:hypothetical protein ACHAXN_002154, partial [Cyclotella atomus]